MYYSTAFVTFPMIEAPTKLAASRCRRGRERSYRRVV